MKTIQFDSAKWMQGGDGAWLCLKCNPESAKSACTSVSTCKKYDAELKEHREKRSLDANAYCWTLIGKLAAVLRITPDEVYRSYIKHVADNCEVVPVREDKIEKWDRIWCAGHVGRMTDDLGECRNIKGYHNIRSYFGSSDYDTKQMSRLIDMVVSDCKDQGIETLTPAELDRLKEDWREPKNKSAGHSEKG